MSAVLMTNVDKKLLRTTKFPPEFDKKVDMEMVNVPVIKKWVADEIARILNSDDDIVAELVYNVLEESRYPKIKELQILINGFLDKDAPKFSKDLWKLLLSAQNGAKGVPQELLEAKKQELEQQQVSIGFTQIACAELTACRWKRRKRSKKLSSASRLSRSVSVN
ncbi:hypothetical protein LTR95_012987 [Oleoguttula sp. CCFEE 5521]